MGNSELKLVTGRGRAESTGGGRSAAWLLTLLFLAAAGWATLSGADAARRTFDPQQLAESALQEALGRGRGDEEVQAKLLDLRRVLGHRPLDTQTRAVYAGLLLSLSSSLSDLRAPAFHADLAATLSPVTVPVVKVSALVLAHSGEPTRSAMLIREMFGYDPRSAADLLRQVDPVLTDHLLALALPVTPQAWLARSLEMMSEGRERKRREFLEEAHARWPEDLNILRELAADAVQSGDETRLRALFPPARALPETAEGAPLVLYRARVRGLDGDLPGAREDIQSAMRAGGDTVSIQILAGDVHASIGQQDQARKLWTRALFRLAPADRSRRRNVLLRLARLEQRHGEPAAALRHWRAVLELDPEHDEATRRVRQLTGVTY